MPTSHVSLSDVVGGAQLDVFAAAAIDDPYPLFGELRRRAPVFRVPGSDFYLVSTWDLVLEATQRVADFSSHLTGVLVQRPSAAPTTFDLDGAGRAVHVLATADDAVHRDQRKLVLPTLVAKRVRALEPSILAVARDLFDEHLTGDRIEWMAAIADRLPMTMVDLLLGLPGEDVPKLVEWGYASTELLGGVLDEGRFVAVVTAAAELADYLHAHFERACDEPGDDLVGDLARECSAGNLDHDAAVLMLVQLVGAGGESTAGLLGNAVRLLATDPALQQQIRANRAALVPFLEESLRLESPFRGHHRHVVADTTIGDVRLPAGSHLMLLWGSANRDSSQFADPDAVVLDRPRPRGHLAFGAGVHFCVGAALALLEARVVLDELLTRTSYFGIAEPSHASWLPSIFVRRHVRLELTTSPQA
ncbi:cytochrome P450 [Antrihabitans sp. YC3-6]|uniref:Cytochrome P450 n=1 Tax=Antrihabitans stalagmiti TaxID=2799499 RepID=A0A934NMD1_9NOCA|nr:cytochrome P450 [Antrihabitans stalagmiti]MBJ8337864.1 cytochrome P450 [Antrihabitans stalagmiti]